MLQRYDVIMELQNINNQYVEYLQKVKRMSLHTVTSYKNDLEQFSIFLHSLGLKDIEKIKSQHIRFWMGDLIQSGLKARSVNRKLSSLRGLFKYCRSHGVIKTDPMTKVVAPKTPKHLVKDIPAVDLMRMFDRYPWNEEEHGDRNKLILLMLYTTGMRLSELINLKIQDVDLNRNALRVLGKRNKIRMIPIHDELHDLINQVKGNRSIGELFLTDKGNPLYPMWLYRFVNLYLRKFSHASKTSPHVLRHSFATHMLNNGANLMAIKDLLGHASLSATQVYTKNSFEKLKKIHQLHPRK